MAPIRLRHPKGVSTIQIDVDSATVEDLQAQIYSITEILPDEQELKSGYPPKSLTLAPEQPLTTIGLNPRDPLVVTQRTSSTSSATNRIGSTTSTTTTTTGSTSTMEPPKRSIPPPSRRPEPAASPPPAPGLAPSGGQRPARAGGGAGASSGEPEYVDVDGGALVHRVVPDDNSCLFSSVALVFEQDISKAAQVRKVVADAIRADADTWTEAILGRPRTEYITTILKPTSWGGAIELSILATHYNTEIASVDVETGRIDHFTPSSSPTSSSSSSSPTQQLQSTPENRCILIYSGIHYDAAALAPMPGAPEDFHQTVFPVASGGGGRENEDADSMLVAAKKLAGKLRAKRAYTNTATFDLKCEVCKKGLKGEKEARAHAAQTGHTEFGEY
ncbi:hypothetical protein BD410DRAFT_771503 [Rickenella mellea]|uniref:Ubiquitin thioesterase OTU n=1 Tax=Rickenella mellea TaxID=50990 RepID=A0A4Y7Q3U2_9AGAM|nr:hypothetical protein BD410DRAFT_771503 [Rickenella mellea]